MMMMTMMMMMMMMRVGRYIEQLMAVEDEGNEVYCMYTNKHA